MKLTEFKAGDHGRITAVPLPRMLELGLIPGTLFRLVSKGPFGDPVELSFYGCDLLIDGKTAAETEAEPCD